MTSNIIKVTFSVDISVDLKSSKIDEILSKIKSVVDDLNNKFTYNLTIQLPNKTTIPIIEMEDVSTQILDTPQSAIWDGFKLKTQIQKKTDWCDIKDTFQDIKCKYNNKCHNLKCTFKHSMSKCTDRTCLQKTCKKRHFIDASEKSKECQFNAECKKFNCKYIHSEERKLCPANNKDQFCYVYGCRTDHIHNKELHQDTCKNNGSNYTCCGFRGDCNFDHKCYAEDCPYLHSS